MRGVGVTFESVWEILTKVGLPFIVIYAGYLYKWMTSMSEKIDRIHEELFEHKAEVNRTFVTHEAARNLELRLTTVLTRIDDKVDRILEQGRK